MATLVLTTVGTLVGGPIGGAIGALIGQQVDQRLFAPKGRQGPRLGDLSVQVSRYGQQLPKLFGMMRVAGSVVWATDLKEDKHKSGGGKGKPKTTTYSYSASFAVVLSARPIRAVHRIWADGKLLRGAAGDWKSQTGFRLYLGDEDQPVDPLIGAAEGLGNTPAFRGLAYAVFEDLQLADFANHIPSMTFEVEADEGAVAVHQIAAELSEGGIAGSSPVMLDGFAASGDSVRGVMEAVGRAVGLSFRDDGTVLRVASADTDAVIIDADMLGSSADERKRAKASIDRGAAGTLPDEIELNYYEPTRDYQTGLQRARRGGPGRRSERIEFSAALSAEKAKALAERRLSERWAQRVSRTVSLPWRMLTLAPGAAVQLSNGAGRWRIGTISFQKMAIEAKLIGIAAAAGDVLPAAAPGRSTEPEDIAQGPTSLHVLDLPSIEDGALVAPRTWIVAAGSSPGWRRAALIASSDAGITYDELGSTAAPATMGTALSALSGGTPFLFDETMTLDVEMLNDAMTLEGRGDDALIGGANLAVLGDELLQFGRVQQIGPRRFRLSRLVRGRRGTEWAMNSHAAGDRFIMIEADTLLAYDLPAAKIGAEISVIASGVGDETGIEYDLPLIGRSVRPPSPVHIRLQKLGDGTLRFSWARRSRIGWSWLDGTDAALGEESESYQIEIMPSVGIMRMADASATFYDYGPAEQLADGSTGASSVSVSIGQKGSIAASLPGAAATFAL